MQGNTHGFTKGHGMNKGKNNPMYGKPSRNKGKKLPQFSGKNAFNWRGGKTGNNGYIMLRYPTHPFCDGRGYIRRSHLIMEKKLGRYLKPKEVVHHINKIKFDDKIENFIVFKSNGYHLVFHRWGYCNPRYIVFDGRQL